MRFIYSSQPLSHLRIEDYESRHKLQRLRVPYVGF